ncbi:DUF423 domain-containing protein [Crocosphaera chwakensis]|uniref:DUF423 domain-containing protein n=1 Tax=Crocosphaera chwakensis CCY0110 TaxID=391612 RepID=A3IW01_9CHRO|nr:DUF423 domain-containing protein [Crocosphaera chwakensis]EAZ89312.1 hypothetical protein CY0110_20420 [Crocosphaera chwakensis CCY0110]
MIKLFLFIGSILAGLSVAGGAFASHALKDKLSDRSLEIFETGTKYQMYHALALILVALLLTRLETVPMTMISAGYAFIIGVLIFSGSLYALSLTGIKWLGAITPIGGAAFLIGWLSLAIAAWGMK